MRYTLGIAVGIAGLALLTACGGERGGVDTAAAGPGGDAAGGTQGRVDKQAEERAIRAVEARWRDVICACDTAAIASFYTEDAIYAPASRPTARGRAAVSAVWANEEFAMPNFSLERTPIRIEVAESGDVATEIGTWVFRSGPTGKLEEQRGGYMFAWRKEGGQWKASAYMYNAGSAPER